MSYSTALISSVVIAVIVGIISGWFCVHWLLVAVLTLLMIVYPFSWIMTHPEERLFSEHGFILIAMTMGSLQAAYLGAFAGFHDT